MIVYHDDLRFHGDEWTSLVELFALIYFLTFTFEYTKFMQERIHQSTFRNVQPFICIYRLYQTSNLRTKM